MQVCFIASSTAFMNIRHQGEEKVPEKTGFLRKKFSFVISPAKSVHQKSRAERTAFP
jgi:hypothetical protein